MASPDKLGRKIAGLLTYNPGPGIYSRLERAVQAMPENVRTQELPGLLKRYKEGVPGWELKATDLDSVIAGRDVVPREELLARVRYASPVYTHGEAILGGRPQTKSQVLPPLADDATDPEFLVPGPVEARVPDYQFPDTGEVSRLGKGVSHGKPRYESYGQGGADYAELLLTQPHVGGNYGSHWDGDTKNVVAHARYDTHGDALRINELQSDLGIHNRKVREAIAREEGMGPEAAAMYRNKEGEELPFPLEDSWADLLIKRLALEAARKGHRAIEVASPRAIADKVGGNIDNYEHFYGKVVPGALERLGRKMGGLVEDVPPTTIPTNRQAMDAAYYEIVNRSDVPGLENRASAVQSRARQLMSMLGAQTHRLNAGHFNDGSEAAMKTVLHNMADDLAGIVGPERMNEMYLRANEVAAAHAARTQAINRGIEDVENVQRPAGRRYIMSDEMRRRLIEQGVGASLLAPLLMQEGE
jgi:hypothetical protein